MNFLTDGEDYEARARARRLIEKLKRATQSVANTQDARWLSDYALGFACSHVAIGMKIARKNHYVRIPLLSGQLPYPTWEQLGQLAFPLIPENLGLQVQPAMRALEPIWAAVLRNQASAEFMAGFAASDCILRSIHDISKDLPNGEPWNSIIAMGRDFARLPGRNPVGALLLRLPFRIYPYLVLRTLGEKVFGARLSPEQLSRAVGFIK